jgi:hypothetical protein
MQSRARPALQADQVDEVPGLHYCGANNWRTAAPPIALATTSIRTMKVAKPDRRVLPLICRVAEAFFLDRAHQHLTGLGEPLAHEGLALQSFGFLRQWPCRPDRMIGRRRQRCSVRSLQHLRGQDSQRQR